MIGRVSRRWIGILLVTTLAGVTVKGDEPATVSSVRITYAPSAKIARGPDEPVLPEGVRPCGAYPSTGNGVLSVSKDMVPPKRVRYKRADFTTLPADERAVKGILFAEVLIDVDGRVTEIHILRSIAPGFDRLFIEELKTSVFQPARLDDRPVPVCMIYTAHPHVR